MNGYVGPPPGGPAGGIARLQARWLQGKPAILPSALQLPAGARRWPCNGASKIWDARHLPPMRKPMPRSPTSPPDTDPAPAPESLSYEQALGELERLVQAMESAQMPLDQMLASYRRGNELLQLCHGRLQAVEAQVKLLDDGQLKPWAAS